MRYLGGKNRLKKDIAETIEQYAWTRNKYFEPFVGGANTLEAIAPLFDEVYASDVQEDVILLYKALQDGWVPPEVITREQYWEQKRSKEPSALRAFVGFGTSFGAKWFGGFDNEEDPEKHSAAKTHRALLRLTPVIRNVEFRQGSYDWITPDMVDDETVVYCDPPYAGTTSYDATDPFDHEKFWDWTRALAAEGALVFISEYSAPDDAEVLWCKEQAITVKNYAEGEEHQYKKDYLFMME